jgi:two-component system, OmpR family, catabolic regulation response regulator CreB
MAHILILEDEPSIAETLVFVLQMESFTTHWESLAHKALNYVQTQAVDLIIMDVGLPDMTGFEACKQLRKFSEVPVVFLTARGDELDRVIGLEIGADDYVVKPFSPREVAARVKAILKRMKPTTAMVESAACTSVNPSEFVIDPTCKTIHFYHELLSLTKIEFNLLKTLVDQPRRVFSREQLLDAVGVAADAGYDRSIDGHIKSLRAKLRIINSRVEPIQTLRGFGYSYHPGSNECR